MKVTHTDTVENSKVRLGPSFKKVNPSIPKKIALSAFFMLFSTFSAFALDAKITAWKGNVDSALKAVVAVFAVVGAFLIFIQYMQGNEQAQKNLIRYVIGLAIFGLSSLVVGIFIT